MPVYIYYRYVYLMPTYMRDFVMIDEEAKYNNVTVVLIYKKGGRKNNGHAHHTQHSGRKLYGNG